jgi:hypothetical protein
VLGQLAGGAATSGIGFTIALFITGVAFGPGPLRTDPGIGILFGSFLAATLGWLIFRLAWQRGAVCAPPETPGAETEPRPEVLAEPVTEADHVLGDPDAPVTLVEYADYECPYCGQLHEVLSRLRTPYGDRLRLVFRNFPLTSVHPHATQAALAAEAAGGQDRFWQMHDQLFTHQRKLDRTGLVEAAERVGLEPATVTGQVAHAYTDRLEADVDSARRSGVRGTPTLFPQRTAV